MPVYPLAFPDGTPYPTIPAGTNVVNVSTSNQLSTALSNATAGQRIVLANGSYSGAFSMSGRTGTAASGISVEAATVGGATFASGSTFRITNCTYVTVQGLMFGFDTAGDTFQFRGTSHHCRITRCTFGPASHTSSTAVSTMIFVGDDCYHIRIDHNEIRNKGTSGNGVRVYGSFAKVDAGQGSSAGCRWVRIDHNIFRAIKPEVGNDKEPVRYGVSTMSRTIANGVIERNVFHDCVCEPEVISVKMGAIRTTGNSIRQCIGGPVIRHGTNSIMSDNYIVDRAATFGTTIGSGGIRFYDADHVVSYNHVDGVYGGNYQGPLMLDTGDAEGSSTNLSAHWRVIGAMVERNVIVDCPEGVRIGDNYNSVPRDCTIRHNLVVNAPTGTAITQRVAPSNTVMEPGNLYFATLAKAGMTTGTDTIARKPGYGPRVTYLALTDVGPAADLSDTDGTGVEVTGGGGGGGTPAATPADVLNIGPDAGQNHFQLQYAVDGSTGNNWSKAEFEQLTSGFSVDPYFKTVSGTPIPGTTQTFGKESDSTGTTSSSATKITVSPFTPTSSGTVTAGHTRAWLSAAGSSGTRLVIYADSTGAPGALLAVSDEVAVTTTTVDTVHNYTFSGANQISVVSVTPYWLGLMWADPGTPSLIHSRDSTANQRWERSASAAPTWTYPNAPATFGTPEGPFSGPSDVWVDYQTPETPGTGTAPAVQFRVRADAATTSGSSFPRSELRETRSTGAEMAFDAMTGYHSLRTKARITHLPTADPEVIVAQLHDGSSDRISVRTQLVSGQTKLLVRINGTEAGRLDESYAVGDEFEVDVRVLHGGLVEVYYQGSTTPVVTGQLVSTGGATWFWKAGAYAQFDPTSAGSATEYVSVEHRDLRVSHSGFGVDAGSDITVVAGQPFDRQAVEIGLTGITSRRWTIVSQPTGPGPGPGPDPDPGTDQTSAAIRHNWGPPLASSDEFNYVGPPNPAKWKLPGSGWAGHAGNGRRRPERQTVDGTKLIMTGLANGDSGWMQHLLDQRYGRWEARIRCFQGAPSAGEPNATSNGNDYHAVALIWPTSNSRQDDGEYDFYELSVPGQKSLVAFMHFPHPGTSVVQQRRFEKTGVDMSQWHNVALEWTPQHLKGFLDGEEWFVTSGGANDVRRNIQDMPSGHGTIQLDNFDGTNQTPATIECEWYRVYPLTTTAPTVPVGTTTKFTDDFSSGNLSKYATTAEPRSYSITVPDIGGGHGRVGRFEVRDGDMWSGGERAEVTLPSSANVAEGDERWYEFDVRLGDPTWGGSVRWTIIMQWHQNSADGSPPLDLSVNSNNVVQFQFEADDVTYPPPIPIWTVRPGVWEHVVLHVKFSKSSSIGFVEAHVNGELKVPKTFRKTLYINDPNCYMKFGVYRTTDNVATAVVMYDNVRISSGPPTS